MFSAYSMVQSLNGEGISMEGIGLFSSHILRYLSKIFSARARLLSDLIALSSFVCTVVL